MNEAAAHALAAKRNAHKGKALWNKTWNIVQDNSDGGFGVRLEDSAAMLHRQADEKRHAAIAHVIDAGGLTRTALDLATDAMLMKCRAMIVEEDERRR